MCVYVWVSFNAKSTERIRIYDNVYLHDNSMTTQPFPASYVKLVLFYVKYTSIIAQERLMIRRTTSETKSQRMNRICAEKERKYEQLPKKKKKKDIVSFLSKS